VRPPKERPISLSDALLLKSRAPWVGATNAYPSSWPSELSSAGINPRAGHDFVEATYTRPEPFKVAIGLRWDDPSQPVRDEDVHVLDLQGLTVKSYFRGSWEHVDPRYRNTHHEPKP
jgi:hypothetical protein